jgi:hypothetical protein
VSSPEPHLEALRVSLAEILAGGLAEDPIEHARQVAEIAGVLYGAFAGAGFVSTLVGGAAIEIHAPGIYRSGDMDVVLDAAREAHRRREDVFLDLGFEREGRHWRHGEELFVEVVSGPVAGPAEEVRVGRAEFRIVAKEVLLRDRLVGFKHWEYTGYGQQAIDMLAAFGDDLDTSWLLPELRREDALDALEALRDLARSSSPVTDQTLRELLGRLRREDNQ